MERLCPLPQSGELCVIMARCNYATRMKAINELCLPENYDLIFWTNIISQGNSLILHKPSATPTKSILAQDIVGYCLCSVDKPILEQRRIDGKDSGDSGSDHSSDEELPLERRWSAKADREYARCNVYEAIIMSFAILPEYRNKGYGTKLLTALFNHLKHGHNNSPGAILQTKPIWKTTLQVRVGNVTAQKLYKQFGFTVTYTIKKYYSDGEDAYQMECFN